MGGSTNTLPTCYLPSPSTSDPNVSNHLIIYIISAGLISDDIGVASSCAKLIYSIMGFPAWTGWVAKCQGGLPDLGPCGV